jgi:hypothetical protein
MASVAVTTHLRALGDPDDRERRCRELQAMPSPRAAFTVGLPILMNCRTAWTLPTACLPSSCGGSVVDAGSNGAGAS